MRYTADVHRNRSPEVDPLNLHQITPIMCPGIFPVQPLGVQPKQSMKRPNSRESFSPFRKTLFVVDMNHLCGYNSWSRIRYPAGVLHHRHLEVEYVNLYWVTPIICPEIFLVRTLKAKANKA